MTRLDPFPQLSTVDAGGLSHRRSNVKRNSQDLAGHAGPMQPVIHDQSSKLRKKSRGSLRLSRRTWVPPLLLMLTFITLYAINPSESNIFRHFLFLSYKLDDQDDQYGKGPWDFAILCSYTILLTFARGFLMQEVLRPLGRLGGIKSRRKLSRFMEQMYTVYYMGFVGLLGLYTMKRTPGLWYFETRAMYESYPHLSHDAVFKSYYLMQAAFSVQQALIMLLGQEERRKDFQELVAHHAIALALIWISYRYHFTYLGLAVFVSHDISDFCLAMSKSLNYLKHRAQIASFLLCIATWIYLRHYINLRILYSIATEYATIGPFGVNPEAGEYKCRLSQTVTFALLAMLQGLNLFWLYLLLRGAYRYFATGVARDDRSEADESEGGPEPWVADESQGGKEERKGVEV